MSWFIESWAVPDGCAFAVQRDGVPEPESLKAPEQVIYICAPHFTPTPVGYATAMAAARGRFQEKFTDNHGGEVAFATLDQLIELVRRAYLASGAGSSPGGENVPPPRDHGPPPLEEKQALLWVEAIRRLKFAETRVERNDTAAFLSSIWSWSASRCLALFCSDIIDTSMQEGPSTRSALHFERDLRDFTLLSVEMNDWDKFPDGEDLLEHLCKRVTRGWWLGPSRPLWGFPSDDLSRGLASGLLERLPCPITWHPYQHLQRLGDHLAAAMADRDYLRSVTSFSQLLPLITCSLALAAAESYRFRSGGPFRDASLVRQRGFSWLAKEVPDSRLDGLPIAGKAIQQVLSKATSANGRSTL